MKGEKIIKEKKISVYLDDNEVKQVEKHADSMTRKRAVEDIEKKIPPSRRRRKVSLSTAARDLIQRGLAKESE